MLPLVLAANAGFHPGYALFVGAGLVLGYAVKVAEERRLGLLPTGQQRWVTAGALLGAMAGAKLGLLLYVPWETWRDSLREVIVGEWGGRTILGALFGGFVGVEFVKKALGITIATGDPYAVALPLGQGLGRIGCFVGGCCYGAPLSAGSSVRHPAQLYEAVFDLAIAGTLFALRQRDWPGGVRFRAYLLAYAAVRFAVDFFRGDEKQVFGPFSFAQWFCLASAAWLAWDVRRRYARAASPVVAPAGS